MSERGSVAPLGIGLAMLSLFAVLLTMSAGTLFLTDRRLTSLAEATALAISTDSEILSDRNLLFEAREFIGSLPGTRLRDVEIVEASAADGLTVRVVLCSSWVNPLRVYSISDTGKICSEGLARRGR